MAWMKWDEKKDGCHWRFKGKRMGLYLRLKWLRKIVSLWGYVSGLGGLMGPPGPLGPPGSRWLIYAHLAWMKWVEKKDG